MRVTANGIGINYEVSGPEEGPVVALSHSLATSLRMWDPQVKTLIEAGYRVLRYDIRGHGGTDVPPGPYTLDMLVTDVRALLAALDIESAHFVGLSLGGMIGQGLAIRYPALLRSLVLCDTAAVTPPEARAVWDERIAVAESQGMEPHVEPTIGRWFTPGFISARSDVVDSVRDMIRATHPQGYTGCAHVVRDLDLRDALAGVEVPTLIIVGEEDPGTPVEAAQVLQQLIPGSELVVLKAASHLSNLEQPEAFNRALLSFLARVEAERVGQPLQPPRD